MESCIRLPDAPASRSNGFCCLTRSEVRTSFDDDPTRNQNGDQPQKDSNLLQERRSFALETNREQQLCSLAFRAHCYLDSQVFNINSDKFPWQVGPIKSSGGSDDFSTHFNISTCSRQLSKSKDNIDATTEKHKEQKMWSLIPNSMYLFYKLDFNTIKLGQRMFRFSVDLKSKKATL